MAQHSRRRLETLPVIDVSRRTTATDRLSRRAPQLLWVMVVGFTVLAALELARGAVDLLVSVAG